MTLATHLALHKKHGQTLVALGNMHGTGWGTDAAYVRQVLADHPIDTAIAKLNRENITDGRISYLFEKKGYDINAMNRPWAAMWGGHFSVNASFVKANNIRWNETFVGWGGEDNEYGIQLQNAGANFQFCEDIHVVHYPTDGSLAVSVDDPEAFKKNYDRVRDTILSLHPDNPSVIKWHSGK